MPRATFAPLIGPEFEPFLFASVGDDPDGRRLSVLSAFARTDLDPWREAERLAQMPREKATARLSDFIAAIPDRPAANIPAMTVASHLVTLLPTTVGAAPRAYAKSAKVFTPSNAGFGLGLSAIALLVVLALISMQQQKVGNRTNTQPATSTERTPPPPPALGQ